MKLKLNYAGKLPKRLTMALEAVRSEEDALAADELVVLGEEILLHLAALGISVYLGQEKQRSALNDFATDLFLSNGSQYNAGPIWRWVAHMIQDAQGPQAEALRPFFWKDGKLNSDVHHAAHLRNMVMHGFFVLPPETNREEAMKLCAILDRMGEARLFSFPSADFHFIEGGTAGMAGFSGTWTAEEGDWGRFAQCGAFGTKASRVALEFGDNFLRDENSAMEKTLANQSVMAKLSLHDMQGSAAVLVAHRPDDDGVGCHAAGIHTLTAQGFEVLHFRIDSAGAAFTSEFLAHTIMSKARTEGVKVKSKRDWGWYAKACKSGEIRKPWAVAVHGIHWATGNKKHILNILPELREAGIPFIATGWPLEEVVSRFLHVEFCGDPFLPDKELSQKLMLNRIRFRGPDPDRPEDQDAYSQLVSILDEVIEEVQADGELVARRFADLRDHPIEFVHEVFSALTACLRLERRAFEPVVFDPLYNFPKEMNESAEIYLALGRHDLQLEYRHRVLTIHPEA